MPKVSHRQELAEVMDRYINSRQQYTFCCKRNYNKENCLERLMDDPIYIREHN